jgi:hypothetical protein
MLMSKKSQPTHAGSSFHGIKRYGDNYRAEIGWEHKSNGSRGSAWVIGIMVKGYHL